MAGAPLMLARQSSSVVSLKQGYGAIEEYLATHNDDSKPFVWTA